MPFDLPIAAVGPLTGAACVDQLGRIDLIPATASGRALATALAGWLLAAQDEGGPQRVVAPGSDRALPQLEPLLEPHGIEVIRIPVYRTVPAPPVAAKSDLAALGIEVILLASPSAGEGLLNQADLPPDVVIVTIGPTTSAAAREAKLAVAGEADEQSIEGLLEAIP